MQKLDIVGLIVVVSGLFWFVYQGPLGVYKYWLFLTFLQIGIGIGILVVPRIAKRKKQSTLEKRKNDQSAESLRDSSNADGPKISNSQNGKKCKVCGTNIPPNKKNCPGCGDIYS